MEQTNVKTIALTCPSCGEAWEMSAKGEKAICPYCGHTIFIGEEVSALEEDDQYIANAGAEEDAEYLQQEIQHKSRIKGWLIAFCVVAAIGLLGALVPHSPMHELFFPRKANPFIGVNIKFTGMSGEGRAELQIVKRTNAEYLDEARYEIKPESGLHNGDVVTVKAKAPIGWRFEPDEKQFRVNGLTTWVLSSIQLRGDNLASIHANTERLIREDWEDIVHSSFATDITYNPYRMYLFISDEQRAYNRNVLYDTYEVNVTRKDGSVFTSYEACRYSDLKIPADKVLTANYGSLQGFNFGFNHGFSYAQAFSGWTSADEMEANLRYVNEGYHLAD